MEKEKQDAVFWLPSKFLDDDFFGEEDKSRVSLTESDEEDDYLAGLTKQMTHSILLNDEKERSSIKSENPKVMAGSPQSTLCGQESPDGPSEVNSPPSSPLEPRKEDSWDLLYEAAGQVMRMRLNQAQNSYAAQGFQGYGMSGQQRKPVSQPSPAPLKNYAGLYPNQNTVLTQRQIQAAQFYHMRQQQLIKQQQQKLMSAGWGKPSRNGIGSGYGENGCTVGFRGSNTPLGLAPSAWPPLPKQNPNPQPGSGMRAVFLSETGTKRESAGTGVFLPRRVGSTTEQPARKKPNFSTVLLPAKVVQTLNLNLDELGVQPRINGGVLLDHDTLVNRTNMMASANAYQRRSGMEKSQPVVRPLVGHDVNLPQEWTY